jgi:(2R)-3-sulfolactate dehydrogenase (NADP+)
MTITLSATQWSELATRVLCAAGTSRSIAATVADALVAADCDGIGSHGLSRLPVYAAQVRCGKVDGKAEPTISRPGAAVVAVDARDGFAYPALALGLGALAEAGRAAGVAILAVRNSHHCGVLGHHVAFLAERGLVALAFANTPAAIAPWGGTEALMGTNPIAFACPRQAAAPLVIDLSLSVAARGRIVVAARDGKPIPGDWALDADGHPTTDAKAALAGTLAAFGGAKGAALALMVELLAAGLADAHYGFEASSFLDDVGPPPRTGQLFVAIDPDRVGGEGFAARAERLFSACLGQPGVRLPGTRRDEQRRAVLEQGLTLPRQLYDQLTAQASSDK